MSEFGKWSEVEGEVAIKRGALVKEGPRLALKQVSTFKQDVSTFSRERAQVPRKA
jgi:hypothetical protein